VSLWTASLILTALLLLLLCENGNLADQLVAEGYVMYFPAAGSLATVGALLAVHRSNNPIGWIFLLASLAGSVYGVADRHAYQVAETTSSNLPGSSLLFWLGTWIWVFAFLVPPTFGILLFPTGQLPSQRWRPFAWILALLLSVLILTALLSPKRFIGPDGAYPQYTNPTGIDGLAWVYDAIPTYGALAFAVGFAGAIASIVARLRRASDIERRQIKWFTYAATLPLAGVVITVLTGSFDRGELGAGEYVTLLGIVILPISVSIAILRHNLYDIDRLINRSLVYGLLTALLLISFGGGVLLFQFLLSPFTGGNDLAVAGSTLLTLVLFRPVRTRLQGFVDRRFYRRKYDAQRTLRSFGLTARDAVDVDQLIGYLARVVSATMQPEQVSVWLSAGASGEDRL
jgi:hypothetical protein